MSKIKQKVAMALPTGRWFGYCDMSELNMTKTTFLNHISNIRKDNPGLVTRKVHATTKIASYKWSKSTKAAYIRKLKGGGSAIKSKGEELFNLFMNA